MFVDVYCAVFVVRCSLSVVRCLLFVAGWLMFAVWYGCRMLCLVCWLMLCVVCWLLRVRCLLVAV